MVTSGGVAEWFRRWSVAPGEKSLQGFESLPAPQINNIIKGKLKQIKGKVKEESGKLTGNKSQEIKGDAQQAAGKVQEQYGKVEKSIKKAMKD